MEGTSYEYNILYAKPYQKKKLLCNNKEQNMIENIERIIKEFLLLNDIEQHQVYYIIKVLETGNENEKRIICESIGLEKLIV